MPTVFEAPPIVELIAEVRWGDPSIGFATNAIAQIGTNQNPAQPVNVRAIQDFEPFFMRFTVEAHRMGFTTQERVAPADSIVMPYQVIWRWRKPDSPASPIIQLGIGVFTVNGGPPNYEHWDGFSSTLRDGLDSLVLALDTYPGGVPAEITQTALRYIDRFDKELMGDMTSLQFMHDALGLRIDVPDVILGCALDAQKIEPMLRLTVPIEAGELALFFSKGVAAGKEGLIMDTTVVKSSPASVNTEALMQAFSQSHDITNKIFITLTKAIHDRMRPRK